MGVKWIGPAPGVRIPRPDLLAELRSGRMNPREFIAQSRERAGAIITAGWWRGSGDPPPPEETVNWEGK